MIRLALSLLAAAILANPLASAAPFRSRGAHVHGNATLDIALEGRTVHIEFESPAINVLGFEHAPRSAQENATLREADAIFESAERVFAWPSAANCRRVSANRSPIAFEQDDEDEKPNAPQANYLVTYTFDCLRPEKLDSIDAKLFAVTLGMQKITVNLVTESVQRRIELSAGQTHISLKAD